MRRWAARPAHGEGCKARQGLSNTRFILWDSRAPRTSGSALPPFLCPHVPSGYPCNWYREKPVLSRVPALLPSALGLGGTDTVVLQMLPGSCPHASIWFSSRCLAQMLLTCPTLILVSSILHGMGQPASHHTTVRTAAGSSNLASLDLWLVPQPPNSLCHSSMTQLYAREHAALAHPACGSASQKSTVGMVLGAFFVTLAAT